MTGDSPRQNKEWREEPTRDTADSSEPFGKLEDRLHEQNTLLASATDGGRTAARLSIAAIMDFIDSEPRLAGKGLNLLLGHLLVALTDLDEGARPKMLLPAKRVAGRRPDAGMISGIRAYTAFTMDILIELGCSEEEAARKVDRVLERSSISVKQRSKERIPTWKSVREWRRGMTPIPDNFGSLSGDEQEKFPLDAMTRHALKNLYVAPVRASGDESKRAALQFLESLLKRLGSLVSE
jgi:hypothetical protein